MSWWVYLRQDGKSVAVAPHEDGGTYAVGGTGEAELNVTYNYSGLFSRALGCNFKDLNDKKAEDVIPLLKKAVAVLGTETDRDYWKATPGNAGACLARLLSWAREYPSAVFELH